MSDDNLLRLATLAVVSGATKELYDDARKNTALEAGARVSVRSPLDGEKIGTVSMSDPDPKPRISDERAFADWAEKTYPDDVEWDFAILGSHEQVAAVLYEHAPELVKRIAKVSPHFRARVLEDSTDAGMPVGPGGEADVPGVSMSSGVPSLRVVPAKGALPVVIELMRERMPLELLAGGDDAA
ncbi:hypothetical protein ACIOD2_32170 [Amycolatopsis sp. NPDC088138]|uniref:hypothetical protein n=1 Tax=Amycolatopsis sp. NPDC088138 TaxID=3363938 RepID=UPI0037F2BDFC